MAKGISLRLEGLADDELAMLIQASLGILLKDIHFFMRHPDKFRKVIDRLSEYNEQCEKRHESLISKDLGGKPGV